MTNLPETITANIIAATCNPECPLRAPSEETWYSACDQPDATPYDVARDVASLVAGAADLEHPSQEAYESLVSGITEEEATDALLTVGADEDRLEQQVNERLGRSGTEALTAEMGLRERGWNGLTAHPDLVDAAAACIVRNRIKHCITEL